MELIRLATKSIRGSGFRSLAIFIAVAGVAGFLVATTLFIAGARNSLDSGLKRLGADILLVPAGTESQVETALLMGRPLSIWLPRESIQQVNAVSGVEATTPQIYLTSVWGAPSCSVPEMFLVVFDPATDFTVTPWLQNKLQRNLSKGEVIGGTHISLPKGSKHITVYGDNMTLAGNLEPTGTGIDQTLFMTMDTAMSLKMVQSTTTPHPRAARRSTGISSSEFSLEKHISTILVRVAPGADPHRVALQILRDTEGMVPIESPQLFGAFRSQMNGLLWGFFIITLVVWVVAIALIGVVFSMAANERRREMAVLRATGATRNFIFRSVLTEAAILAFSGAAVGIAGAAVALFLFKDIIAGSLNIPFLFPSIPSFISLFGAGIALAIISVALSALIPALRLSRQELALAMRE